MHKPIKFHIILLILIKKQRSSIITFDCLHCQAARAWPGNSPPFKTDKLRLQFQSIKQATANELGTHDCPHQKVNGRVRGVLHVHAHTSIHNSTHPYRALTYPEKKPTCNVAEGDLIEGLSWDCSMGQRDLVCLKLQLVGSWQMFFLPIYHLFTHTKLQLHWANINHMTCWQPVNTAAITCTPSQTWALPKCECYKCSI